MAKNYILEPVEFDLPSGNYLPISDPEGVFNSLVEGTILDISGTKLKFVGVYDNMKLFTPDGNEPESDDTLFAALRISDDNMGIACNFPSSTYTISIYTETPDPAPDPGAGLSKNIVHNDHPYNNWGSEQSGFDGFCAAT